MKLKSQRNATEPVPRVFPPSASFARVYHPQAGTDPAGPTKPGRRRHIRRRRVGILTVLAVFLWLLPVSPIPPPVAQAQNRTNPGAVLDSETTDRLTDAGWSNTNIDTVLHLLEQVHGENLPTEQLVSRIREGAAKRIPPDRVTAVLEQDITHLRTAARTIRNVPGGSRVARQPGALERGANLLRGGYTPADLEHITHGVTTRPEAFRPGALLYVAVTEWGAAPDEAAALLDAAVSADISTEDFPRLTALLTVATERRIPTGRAVTIITEELAAGRSLREIQRLLTR
jgi:hypothetical protein